MAITPFQVPAATGGNGAIRYTATGLPSGLTFDGTGTDADGCPGAAPRTVCGTPTRTGSRAIYVYAEDTDSNRGDDDRASLRFDVRVYGASIASTSPAALTEGALNNATVTVNLAGTTFGSGVTASGFELVTAIPNVSIASVSRVDLGTATLTLAFTGNFATDQTLAVRVKAAAHARGGDLTTGAVTVLAATAADVAPSFGSATVPTKNFPEGVGHHAVPGPGRDRRQRRHRLYRGQSAVGAQVRRNRHRRRRLPGRHAAHRLRHAHPYGLSDHLCLCGGYGLQSGE